MSYCDRIRERFYKNVKHRYSAMSCDSFCKAGACIEFFIYGEGNGGVWSSDPTICDYVNSNMNDRFGLSLRNQIHLSIIRMANNQMNRLIVINI